MDNQKAVATCLSVGLTADDYRGVSIALPDVQRFCGRPASGFAGSLAIATDSSGIFGGVSL